MMFPTTEVRWFFRGEIPPAAASWFAARICANAAQPPRTDYYLWLDENDSLGIKLREGRMEVKQRQDAGAMVQLGGKAAGMVESWCKWSFELADAAEDVTGQWMGVWKARRWCLFAVGENGRITPASPDSIVEQGCACELTEVRLTDSSEPWWSLGFESFGGTAVRRCERLQYVAKHFLTQPGAPTLPAEQSYSYPKWLQMAKRGRRPT